MACHPSLEAPQAPACDRCAEIRRTAGVVCVSGLEFAENAFDYLPIHHADPGRQKTGLPADNGSQPFQWAYHWKARVAGTGLKIVLSSGCNP